MIGQRLIAADMDGYLKELHLTEPPFGFVKVAEPYDPDMKPAALDKISMGMPGLSGH